ncbi:DUF1810 domain-containing protein [Thiomicrorhabdus sp.]|uniref:DUF1810 domain-containing protein n=1 Tax=Thiomicrorhabdus sp. TaxID=2039724 RepID=UPI0029C854A4|nr:DUF1810 domain-containing protein [Thiomicrorhabdus sp.]
MITDDFFNLQRFVEAQEPVYATVLSELKMAHKQTHWMWFIFPQIDGLGSRPYTVFYSIKSLQEAQAYLQHPLLGSCLIECTQTVLAAEGKSLLEIFGKPDNRKFCSCMTLFCTAAETNSKQQRLFLKAIEKYCGGDRDLKTLDILKESKL